MAKLHSRKRGAFTLVELTVATAIFAILVVIVAQCISVSLRERARMSAHQAASELAANVLEDARAQPFEKLNKTWADAQTIPSEMAALLPEGKIAVTAGPEKATPRTRRVTVDVHWQFEQHLPMQSVRLTTLLGGRAAKKAGGEP